MAMELSTSVVVATVYAYLKSSVNWFPHTLPEYDLSNEKVFELPVVTACEVVDRLL